MTARPWSFVRRTPKSWGSPIVLCCPRPPAKRVPLEQVLRGLQGCDDPEGRTRYANLRAGQSARILGLDAGNGHPRPLGVVVARAQGEGLFDPGRDPAEQPALRYLVSAALLARDGLPCLAVLAAMEPEYRSANVVARDAAALLREVCARWGSRPGVVARRVAEAAAELAAAGNDGTAIVRLRWRVGLLDDLGLVRARSYCGGLRLTPEGVPLAREVLTKLRFGPLEDLHVPHLRLAPWLARVPSRPATGPDETTDPESVLLEAARGVAAGHPAPVFPVPGRSSAR